MGIIERISGNNVYLDTNIFIYILEGGGEYEKTLAALLDAVEQDEITCYSSALTLAEALVIPFKKGQSSYVKKYSNLLRDERFVTLLPTTNEIYIKAAFYRAELNLTLPDAIHVAAAVEAGCDIFLTNDKRLKVPKKISLMLLE